MIRNESTNLLFCKTCFLPYTSIQQTQLKNVSPEPVYYFSYGSNNNRDELIKFVMKSCQDICNTPLTQDKLEQCFVFHSIGLLPDYYLSFASSFFKRGNWGVGTIIKSPGHSMMGIIYQLVPTNDINLCEIIALLRRKEMFPFLYNEQRVDVLSLSNNSMKTNIYIPCFTYRIRIKEVLLNQQPQTFTIGCDYESVFPILELPGSQSYSQLIVSSVENHPFPKEWKQSMKEINQVNKLFRSIMKKNIDIIKDYYQNRPQLFPMIRYLQTHYHCKYVNDTIMTHLLESDKLTIYILLAVQEIIRVQYRPIYSIEPPWLQPSFQDYINKKDIESQLLQIILQILQSYNQSIQRCQRSHLFKRS